MSYRTLSLPESTLEQLNIEKQKKENELGVPLTWNAYFKRFILN